MFFRFSISQLGERRMKTLYYILFLLAFALGSGLQSFFMINFVLKEEDLVVPFYLQTFILQKVKQILMNFAFYTFQCFKSITLLLDVVIFLQINTQ